MTTTRHQDFTLTPVDPQDVDQEAALLQLEHPEKRPNRSLISKRLRSRELSFGTPSTVGELHIQGPAFAPPIPNLEAPAQLVTWAQSTGDEEVLEVILHFLLHPEEALTSTIQWLSAHGYITLTEGAPTTHQAPSISQLIREEYQRGTPVEEITQMVRSLSPSRRPEALVRTVIRRMHQQEEEEGDNS